MLLLGLDAAAKTVSPQEHLMRESMFDVSVARLREKAHSTCAYGYGARHMPLPGLPVGPSHG